MKIVVIGSQNPVKVATVKSAFTRVFPDEVFEFISHGAHSGVSEQPMSDAETKRGAQNRVHDCRKHYEAADYFVGLEGGIENNKGELWSFAWMCVENNEGRVGSGKTGSFLLPPSISLLIQDGIELGSAIDTVFDKTNSKHKEGAVGTLTQGQITREALYFPALVFALIPFIQPELYTLQ